MEQVVRFHVREVTTFPVAWKLVIFFPSLCSPKQRESSLQLSPHASSIFSGQGKLVKAISSSFPFFLCCFGAETDAEHDLMQSVLLGMWRGSSHASHSWITLSCQNTNSWQRQTFFLLPASQTQRKSISAYFTNFTLRLCSLIICECFTCSRPQWLIEVWDDFCARCCTDVRGEGRQLQPLRIHY